MDTSYYPDQLFTPINMSTLCNQEEMRDETFTPIQTNGLVYSHIQQALQVQTVLKNQQRVQNFLLNSAVTEDDSMLGFDELYSSVTTESDLSYLQLMQQNEGAFYTPLGPFADSSLLNSCNNTFDMSALPSVAGLDTGCSFSSPQQPHYGLYHPLSAIPDETIDMNGVEGLACDYYLDNNDILAGIDCNAFNPTKNYYKDIDASSFAHPIISYPSLPTMSYSSSTNNTDASDRNNSTPLLSASYSFSSFSSASSNEEDSTEEDLKETKVANKRGPKKSASMSFFPEQRKNPMLNRKNSAPKLLRKFSQKRGSITSDLSYYLSRQKLSDTEEFEEEFEDDLTYNNLKTEISTSASTGMICKKGRNVDRACNHCKRSHLRCDNVRPCRRCVATGKTGCQDVKHKPRGRPRLQKNL